MRVAVLALEMVGATEVTAMVVESAGMAAMAVAAMAVVVMAMAAEAMEMALTVAGAQTAMQT